MKKVLSLLVVVAMLFSMCALTSSAVVNDGALIAIKATPTEGSYSQGDVITFEVSVQTDASLAADGIGAGIFVFGYNSAVLEPIVDLSSKVTDYKAAGVILDGYAYGEAGFIQDAASSVQTPSDALVAEDVAKGWDKAINITLGSTFGEYRDFSTETKVFAFQMKVKADAANGEYEVGITKTSLGATANTQTWLDDTYGGFSGENAADLGLDDGPVFDRQMSVVKVGPSVVVSHVKQQSKWRGGNDKNTAENYLFGFVGQLSGLTLTTTEKDGRNMINEIKSITATATISGSAEPKTAEVITVWAVDGGYQFRAQFAGFTPDMTNTVSVVFAVTLVDGTTIYTSAASEAKTINSIYTTSVGLGLPALAA